MLLPWQTIQHPRRIVRHIYRFLQATNERPCYETQHLTPPAQSIPCLIAYVSVQEAVHIQQTRASAVYHIAACVRPRRGGTTSLAGANMRLLKPIFCEDPTMEVLDVILPVILSFV